MSDRFTVLDSFRGIAAVLVAFMHLQALHQFYFAPFVRHSFLFVDFFFALSGFVVSYAYRATITDHVQATKYAIRRFGRIWPLHAAVLALLLLAQVAALLLQLGGISMPKPPFTENWSLASIPTNLLLLQSLGVHDHGTWNLPSWSISAEFWAYLIFAAVLLFGRKYLVPTSVLLILSCLSALYAMSPDFMDATYDYGLFRCLAGFFAGVLVHVYWKRLDIRRNVATVLEVAALGAVVLFVVFAGGKLASLLAPGVFAGVVYLFAQERGAVSSVLRSWPFLALGRWSYSIYMVHSIYYLVVLRNGPRVLEKVTGTKLMTVVSYEGSLREVLSVGGPIGTSLLALVYLAAVIVTAALTYRLVEVPSRSWFAALADRVGARLARDKAVEVNSGDSSCPAQRT